jgi:hypothetical protein
LRPFDNSDAECALSNHLVFWTSGNCERAIRLLKQSPLAEGREAKFNRGDDYLGRTMRDSYATIKATAERQGKTPFYSSQKVVVMTEPLVTDEGVYVPSFGGHESGTAWAIFTETLGAGEMLRFSEFSKSWWRYESTMWVERTNEYVESFVQELSYLAHAELTAAKISGITKQLKMLSITAFKKNPVSFTPPIDVEPDLKFLPFLNGIYNTVSGELVPHGSGNLNMYVLPYDYEHQAVSPMFQTFINQATGGDPEMIEALQIAAGSFLSDRQLQQSVMLIGRSGTGKGTFIHMMEKVIGEENTTAARLNQLNS